MHSPTAIMATVSLAHSVAHSSRQRIFRCKLGFHRNRSELRHIGGRKSRLNYLRGLVPHSDTNPINGTFGDPASTLASGSVANPSLTDLNSSPPAAPAIPISPSRVSSWNSVLESRRPNCTAGDYWVGFVLNMANNFPAGYEADYYWANTSNGDGIFKALLTSQLNLNGTWTAGPANPKFGICS